MSDAKILLWGRVIGAVSWSADREIGTFQYSPDFSNSGIQVSPLMMPLREFPYEFPSLNRKTFRGLPGLLADSLPDKFGNAIIDAWLSSQGRNIASFNSVERLCYIGKRGMGALEFEPTILGAPTNSQTIEVSKLVALANKILDKRNNFEGVFLGKNDSDAMEHILRVGTSAGGARAKAILAWNPDTNEFRSGQVENPPGFEYWLLKFDGVKNNRDKELADPLGYGKIEYAYYLMASKAGIKMTKCKIFPEGGRSHFMTKRFDRTDTGGKTHMQSLGAIAHYDFNQPASYSYEQAIQIMKRLDLPREDLEQQVLRAMFNVISRNQDDHVKNITFLMDRRGNWKLSPAYDITYAYDPHGVWTSQHQMSINGKRDNFSRDDLIALAKIAGIKSFHAKDMLAHVLKTVSQWENFAKAAKVEDIRIAQIRQTHRLNL